ncbi:MAG: hypothetical protein ABL891_17595 [Burkholderiales bacterium]
MLSAHDHKIIAEALRAAAEGPFFPDWEFHTLFGLEREEVRAYAKSYHPATDVPVKMGYAVHNAIGNLLGYPHGKESEWSNWLSVTRSELNAVFERWRSEYDYA